jgi:hypothetical protein
MLAVLMLAVLAGIALVTFGRTHESVRKVSLDSNAVLLNKAVDAYRSGGGSMTGVTDAAALLAKLKTKAAPDQEQQIAGLRGPFVDLRLALVPAEDNEDYSLAYDANSGSFSVVAGHDGLVPVLSEALAAAPVATENRQVSLAMAKKEPWVWDYKDATAASKAPPDQRTNQDLGHAGPTTSTPQPAAQRLQPPTFSRGSFQLGTDDFPTVISLRNINPPGSSQLYFRINGGSWTDYTAGISLPLEALTKLEAYANPLSDDWLPSGKATETYTFVPGQLTAPVIAPASGSFRYDEYPTTLTLQDTNAPHLSQLQYKLGAGDWANYSAPVSLTPETLLVTARALPVDSQRWVASPEATAMYDLLQQLLQAPTFSKAAGQYAATDYPLSITINNPNIEGSSKLQYRQKGGAWQDYSTAVSLSYNQLDVTLEAQAVTLKPTRWITSPVRPSRYQLLKATLRPPVVTPPGGYYPYNSFPAAVTMENPNATGTSEIWYRFGMSGNFVKYDAAAPPALNKDNFSTTLVTYARSLLSAQYKDSVETNDVYQTIYFTGATAGLFHDPVGEGNSNNAMVSNLPAPKQGADFHWGSTNGNSGLTQSTMQFAGAPSFKTGPGEWFHIGKLTYYNGTIVSGTGAASIKLKFAFNLTQPTATTTSADYEIKLINTKNIGTEAENADYVYLPTLGVPFSTTVGGRKFQLDVRFGETTANGFGNVSEFHIYEGKSATGTLYGRITEIP